MNPSTQPQSPRDGITVPSEFAAELAARSTEAARRARRALTTRRIWLATAAAAVFAGAMLMLRPHTAPSAGPTPQLTADEAWSALEQGDVTLTEDELLELAELHGITTL